MILDLKNPLEEPQSEHKYFMALRLQNKTLLNNLRRMQERIVSKYAGIERFMVDLSNSHIRFIQFSCNKTELDVLIPVLRSFVHSSLDLFLHVTYSTRDLLCIQDSGATKPSIKRQPLK